MRGDLHRTADDAVEFDGPAGLDILQHRGLDRAELARLRHALFGLHGKVQPERVADAKRLHHHRREQACHVRVVKHQVGGDAGQHRHRVEADVAEQLHPDVAPDIVRRSSLETRSHQGFREDLDPRRGLVRRLANDHPAARIPAHHARLGHIRRQKHHTADHARLRNRACDAAIRVAGLERSALQGAAPAVEEPPGDAVHRRHHGGIRPEQGPDALYCGRQAVPLERDDHHVLMTEVGSVVAGRHAHRVPLVAMQQGQAIGADRVEMRAARDHADLIARQRETRAERAADGAGAVDADFHF